MQGERERRWKRKSHLFGSRLFVRFFCTCARGLGVGGEEEWKNLLEVFVEVPGKKKEKKKKKITRETLLISTKYAGHV